MHSKNRRDCKSRKTKRDKTNNHNIHNVGTVISSEVVDVVKMKPKVISTSQYRDYVLGNNATVTTKAIHEKRFDYCNRIRII